MEPLMTALTYDSYLHTETLLSLQRTRTPDTADRSVALSEQFFIVAHQSSELWLKQLLSDLAAAVDRLSPAGGHQDLEESTELLQRAGVLLRVLHDQVVVLERLPVRHFAQFRPHLGSASGAQSRQFSLLARLVENESDDGTLYRAFTAAALSRGTSVLGICRQGVTAGALHRIAEELLDIGNGYWRWKVAHLGLVAKMMAGQNGSGGTSGADHLLSRIIMPFAELRRVRGQLHETLAPAEP
jgi:tryptophan 2,3-dioxygenase